VKISGAQVKRFCRYGVTKEKFGIITIIIIKRKRTKTKKYANVLAYFNNNNKKKTYKNKKVCQCIGIL
jgi:hypothetical protein